MSTINVSALLATSLIAMTGCEAPAMHRPTEPPAIVAADIVGTYVENPESCVGTGDTLVFGSDGRVSSFDRVGTWSAEGATVSVAMTKASDDDGKSWAIDERTKGVAERDGQNRMTLKWDGGSTSVRCPGT